MACSIESTRTYIAPSWLDNSLAIVVFPVPGNPPKMTSIGGRLSGAYVLKFPIRRFYLESKLFWKIGFRHASCELLSGSSANRKVSGLLSGLLLRSRLVGSDHRTLSQILGGRRAKR